MGDITLNSAVRANLRTLQSASDLMSRTQKRISTGKKVSSALDNPSSFFTAQALNQRSSDLNGLLDSVSNSVQTLKAADNGIKAITDVVESLKATARSALQSPSAVATKASVESGAVTGLSASDLIGSGGGSGSNQMSFTYGGPMTFGSGDYTIYSLTVDGTTYSSGITSTITGSVGNHDNNIDNVSELVDSLNLQYQAQLGLTATSSGNTITIDGGSHTFAISNYQAHNGSGGFVDTTGMGNQTATASASGGGNAGKTLSVKDRSGATKTVTLSASGVNTISELNAWLKASNVALMASVTTSGSSGKLRLEASNDAANSTPADIAGTITDAGGSFAADRTFSAPVLDPTASAKRAGFAKDYTDALAQISSLAKDASYNGVNLLKGDDLSIVFNEDGSSKLDVKGTEFSFAGLGLSALGAADFYDADSINKVLDKIDDAFGTLEQQSSKFGSQLQIVQTRQDFTKNAVGTLEDGAAALTDADTDEEAANLATLQTRISLMVSSLTISTSSEQNILKLLR